ncbi:MAG: methylenetetrahydrofolate--tRNA-(uracil(54)-C(5))-methyltransferase (FADH(2)-oxidizing) TrmFO [Coriobacteriales bacterium]|jgi:methylenetetrahydrofolate--tRNA-(uracil-5-)-methyltransferase|nr:methylenetetrahydrofolate--tRNA-(uracil(54)-C(5))-methyltransferase (FADH(2)-oxidizing) TrmFO [Coriobacteriales bacterium]
MALTDTVTIIGGGLAGSEAAWQLAERGVSVRLYEMRPKRRTPVHKSGDLAELVCSNSLKSLDESSAAGALKYELATLGSYLLHCAFSTRVAAGGALAVDRDAFGRLVTRNLEAHEGIELIREEFTSLPALVVAQSPGIIATGPLTSSSFEAQLVGLLKRKSLAFYDAAAPIVDADSLDLERLFFQSRYDKSGADYLNAPLTRKEYDALIEELVKGERTLPRSFETAELFQACQPIEEVARSGHDTLRYGALKPVGLKDPRTNQRPWAVVQLRPENNNQTAYNLVGFQTNLTFGEQKRIFRLIPGFEKAVFFRYGVMHRNTFIDSPQVLDEGFALRGAPSLRFAGQITGTEGYVEAIASGLFAALATYAQLQDMKPALLPEETVLGSLFAYATDPANTNYQPMHVNYGIVKPLAKTVRRKNERYEAYSLRSRISIEAFRKRNSFLSFLPSYEVPLLLP